MAVVVTATIAPLPTHAQDRYRVRIAENFRREPAPDGRLLGRVNAGTELAGIGTRTGWIEVVLEGWIWARSTRPVNSDEFDLEVSAASGENLRAAPNGSIVARLPQGFWMEEVDRDGDWIQVRRAGWMWERSLAQVAAAAAEPAPDAATAGDLDEGRREDEVMLARAVTVPSAVLRRRPDGDTVATLSAETPVRILSRSGEWVRVQADGWIRQDDLQPASGSVLVAVSGAEVRARPEVFEGKVLQWRLEFIAIQTADNLRRELPEGRKYMLARGPVPETGFVYVLLDDQQVSALERVAPLTELETLVRVRHGRSAYLGNPVVELIEMAAHEE